MKPITEHNKTHISVHLLTNEQRSEREMNILLPRQQINRSRYP